MPNIWSGANWTEGKMPAGHGNPGTPEIKKDWWEEGAAAAITAGAPKLFDYIVKPTKVGTAGGMIQERAAPPDHYGRFTKAKNKAVNSMAEQSNLLEATRKDFLQRTIDSIRNYPESPYKDYSDEEIYNHIKNNPERYYSWSTGDENKNHYMNKYHTDRFTNEKGMSLNDFIAERNRLDERIKKSSNAYNAWKDQPNVGKSIYKSKLPGFTPDWLMPNLPENSVYARDLNRLKEESSTFDDFSWEDLTKKETWKNWLGM